MLKVLYIIPTLEYGGAARQLTLLAKGLPRTDFETRVCSLGPEGPVAKVLRGDGIEVEALGWRRRFDLNPFLRLRQLVKSFTPDVIHTWCLSSLRAVSLADGTRHRLVASLAGEAPAAGLPWRWLDQHCLGRAATVVAADPGEAECYRRCGLPEDKITPIPYGVDPADTTAPARAAPDRAVRLPEDARCVVCAGPLEPLKGYREAIWAFEILRYLYENLHLVLIGHGSDRARLEQFVQVTGTAAGVHFVGPVVDVPGWLARAEVVWVPSLARGGVNVALEAQVAGRPVVASRLPGLVEVVADGETGFLIAPGDKVALARQTRLLLDDAERRRSLGEAGRKRAASQFPAAGMVARFMRLYEG